jgi:predicted nucleic acid-binding protein
MNKILLDTDVIINLLRGNKETKNKFKQLFKEGYKFYISPIVIAEIYAGAFKKEYYEIERLFSFFEKIDINYKIGYQAGLYANQYKKSYNKISLEDYLIAATAKYYNIILWTYNKKHYLMKDIKII